MHALLGQEADQGAEGDTRLRTVGAADLTAIFIIGAIAPIVMAVPAAPLPAGDLQQPLGIQAQLPSECRLPTGLSLRAFSSGTLSRTPTRATVSASASYFHASVLMAPWQQKRERLCSSFVQPALLPPLPTIRDTSLPCPIPTRLDL